MDEPSANWTAFAGVRCLAAGRREDVALAVREALDRDASQPVLVFDDATGRQVDFDLRGTPREVAARLGAREAARGPGRPRLGVVAREVTLLPRHWEWLGRQRGGASVALRRLVDAARTVGGSEEERSRAQEAADRFMMAMAGDLPGYEEAARALYAADGGAFAQRTETWPADLRDCARRLAAPAFAPAPVEEGRA